MNPFDCTEQPNILKSTSGIFSKFNFNQTSKFRAVNQSSNIGTLVMIMMTMTMMMMMMTNENIM